MTVHKALGPEVLSRSAFKDRAPADEWTTSTSKDVTDRSGQELVDVEHAVQVWLALGSTVRYGQACSRRLVSCSKEVAVLFAAVLS